MDSWTKRKRTFQRRKKKLSAKKKRQSQLTQNDVMSLPVGPPKIVSNLEIHRQNSDQRHVTTRKTSLTWMWIFHFFFTWIHFEFTYKVFSSQFHVWFWFFFFFIDELFFSIAFPKLFRQQKKKTVPSRASKMWNVANVPKFFQTKDPMFQ